MKTKRSLGARLFGLAVVAMGLAGACAEKKGGLILAINTDMKAPKDVNAVSVTVSTNGAIKHSFIGRVTPEGNVLLPATLAIVEPEDANASIRIRVMAFQERKPRVLRDVRTTVPRSGRTALLRIPLNFVNDGSTKSAPLPEGILPPAGGGGSGAADFDFFGSFQPDCPDFETQTWIDGECKDSAVDSAALPDYDEAAVMPTGGENGGACFDVAKCFASAFSVQPDAACSFPLPGADHGIDASQLNLAIVTPDTGECLREGECYVPLDQGPNGYRAENGRVQLPPFICKLVGKGLRLFQTIGKCPPKTESQPICRPQAAQPNPNPGPGNLACLSTCGSCVTQRCDSSKIALCFGPDYAQGKVTGVCKGFYECMCACSGGGGGQSCDQCDNGGADGCGQCLQQNINGCVEQNCSAECKNGGGGGDGDGGMSEASVNLSFTPGEPPATPDVGQAFVSVDGFTTINGSSTVLVAHRSDQTLLKITYCAGLLPGQTFTLKPEVGAPCVGGNAEPRIELDLGQPGGPTWDASQGSLRVVSASPRVLQFQGVMMTARSGSGAAGGFSMNGTGSWTGN